MPMLTKKEIKNLIESDSLFLDFAVESVYNRLAGIAIAPCPIESARKFCAPIYEERGKIPAIRALRVEAKNQGWISAICQDVAQDVKYERDGGVYLGLVAAKEFVEKYF
jgi:hypothetical protein